MAGPAPKASSRDAIGDAIKQDIIDGFLNLGQQIPEAEYATRFGVSRTPVREAVLSLSSLGLVFVRPRAGSFVIKFTKESLAELFMARFQIEASSVRYAPRHTRFALISRLTDLNRQMLGDRNSIDRHAKFHDADTQFHRAFVEASGSPRIVEIYEPIEVCALAARARLEKAPFVTKQATEDHQGMIDALTRNDLDGFEIALKKHLDWVQAMLSGILFRT